MPGNAQVWYLLTLASNQWLSSPTGIYGINLSPVMEAARHLGIDIDRCFFDKVKTFESAALKIMRGGEDEGCTPEKRKFCEFQYGKEHMEWICKTCGEMQTDK